MDFAKKVATTARERSREAMKKKFERHKERKNQIVATASPISQTREDKGTPLQNPITPYAKAARVTRGQRVQITNTSKAMVKKILNNENKMNL